MNLTVNKKAKQNGGITLIALIVSIIVLLILAAISIAMLTGENGIINNAITSKRETESATTKEKINLALQATRIEGKGKIADIETLWDISRIK